MTRELFVSSTPHETKVGLVEDDLLAEIYLERENEYTLAGSIYKGRVTRVLPGMQSAFVDIGLERDAFLYVSDFMELEDSEDLDEVPANRPVPERYQAPPQAEAHNGETFAAPLETESQPQEHPEAGAEHQRVARFRASPGTTVAECADGAAVGDAAGSACRNRSSPAQPRNRPVKLPAPNIPIALNALNETNAPNGPNEMIDPSGRSFLIVVDGLNARREPTGPSAPNMDRRRDISP